MKILSKRMHAQKCIKLQVIVMLISDLDDCSAQFMHRKVEFQCRQAFKLLETESIWSSWMLSQKRKPKFPLTKWYSTSQEPFFGIVSLGCKMAKYVATSYWVWQILLALILNLPFTKSHSRYAHYLFKIGWPKKVWVFLVILPFSPILTGGQQILTQSDNAEK